MNKLLLHMYYLEMGKSSLIDSHCRIEWLIIDSVTEYRLPVNIETYATDHLNPVFYFVLIFAGRASV